MVFCCRSIFVHFNIGYLHKFIVFEKQNERNFIPIFIHVYYLEDIIPFKKIANKCSSYIGLSFFLVRNFILGVNFCEVHLGCAYIK